MTNFKFNSIATLLLFTVLTSCSSNSSENDSTSSSNSSIQEKDPYEIMHIAFEGFPEIEKIKPMLESVMQTYGIDKTDDNRLNVANMLVALRKASAVGVTEMDILKHIYQNGSDKIKLPEQAGISATLLEMSK